MTSGSVGTMSTLGFIIDDMNLAMDRHFTYFFASRRDQCKIIPKVPSFEWTLMQNQGNIKKIEIEMKSTLTQYFLEISDSCEVAVGSYAKSDRDGTFNLSIAVSCIKDGVRYDLQKAVLVSGQSFQLLAAARGN